MKPFYVINCSAKPTSPSNPLEWHISNERTYSRKPQLVKTLIKKGSAFRNIEWYNSWAFLSLFDQPYFFLLYLLVSTRAVIGQYSGPHSPVRPAKI